MNKPKIIIQKTDEQVKREQHRAKLADIAKKKQQGKLTLDDIYEQNQIIIEQISKKY